MKPVYTITNDDGITQVFVRKHELDLDEYNTLAPDEQFAIDHAEKIGATDPQVRNLYNIIKKSH